MSQTDPFRATRALFDLPDGLVYLDGNSLGALPKSVGRRVADVISGEWGRSLIGAWNSAGWVDLPRRVGDRVGRLIGAPAGTVTMGDTLSIKVYQALAAALDLKPDRRVILSDTGNFPTDLYMAEGLIASLGRGHELRVVEPEAVEAAIDESVAAVMLTQVDYRTGRLHDMAALTARSHAAGALTIWDLAHSAGALPVDVSGAGADFAVGCTYKYLNGGPGAPAFIFVAPHLAANVRPALSGWFGHDAPFAFEPAYRPAAGVERMRVGTPPILALAALDAALDVWDGIDMGTVRARSIALGELFVREVRTGVPDLELASPADPAARGSQVSFRHTQGYAVMQALIAEGVIGDYRAPDIMRFGFTPLYLGEEEVRRGAAVLVDILRTGRWDTPDFRRRNRVT
ncbi:kynureninase [Aureimonas flava]|uniref:Kynureninase n=1 Tax=Aureimonas flava TaxID=2320271 RepID=A0A3A1WP66_9HYPH|nr:kynureninase [Aureimonas flava]RIY01926.1 kynureninase [Aureimonas flava]